MRHTVHFLIATCLFFLLISCTATPAAPPATLAPTSPLTTLPATSAPTSPPTASSVQPPANGPVTFTTEDGLTLTGTLSGQGKVGVVFSNQNQSPQSNWNSFAPEVAKRGYRVLTYDYRGIGKSQGSYDPLKTALDLRAAIQFMRAQNINQVVLVGSSLGGMITAKAAIESKPDAVVVMSAPDDALGITVTERELKAIAAPKLFINSEGDNWHADTLRMNERAGEPKELVIYKGSSHGVALFDDPNAEDLPQQILAFLDKYAPAE
jgi:alpha/beta superfamily hydrolase